MRPALLCVCLMGLGLAGCATPQEKAIAAYCANEAAARYPAQLVTQTVQRQVQVGERIVGKRSKCRTTEQLDKRRGVRIEESICTDEPIREPIYEPRMVQETIDLNQGARNNHAGVCRAQSMQAGLFADLK